MAKGKSRFWFETKPSKPKPRPKARAKASPQTRNSPSMPHARSPARKRAERRQVRQYNANPQRYLKGRQRQYDKRYGGSTKVGDEIAKSFKVHENRRKRIAAKRQLESSQRDAAFELLGRRIKREDPPPMVFSGDSPSMPSARPRERAYNFYVNDAVKQLYDVKHRSRQARTDAAERLERLGVVRLPKSPRGNPYKLARKVEARDDRNLWEKAGDALMSIGRVNDPTYRGNDTYRAVSAVIADPKKLGDVGKGAVSYANALPRLLGAAASDKTTVKEQDARMERAGLFPTTGAAEKGARTLGYTGRALATSGKARSATLRSLPRLAIGVPAGIALAVSDPAKAVHEGAADYKRRYGAKNYAEFRKRVEREGVAPELLDAGSVLAVSGRVAGVAAEARGGRAAEFLNAPRPKLMEGAGRAVAQRHGSRPLGLPRNALTVAGHRTLDRARAERMRRRIVAGTPQGKLDEVALRDGGAVSPLTRRGLKRAKVRLHTQTEATTRLEKRHGEQFVKGLRGATGGLSREQLDHGPFRFAVELGIRTPEHAKAVLPKYADLIRRSREGTPARHHEHDTLAEVDHAIAHADEMFTPKLARLADAYVEHSAEIGRLDPRMGKRQAATRAGAPQAIVAEPEHRAYELSSLEQQDQALEALRAEAPGLKRGAYFYHSPDADISRLSYALGSGTRGPQATQATGYGLFREGRADSSFARGEEGLMRNARAIGVNTLTSRYVDDFTPAKLYDQTTKETLSTSSLTAKQARDVISRSGTKGALVPVNVGVLRENLGELQMLAGKADEADLAKLTDDAFTRARDVDGDTANDVTNRGWAVMDRAALDSIQSDMNRSGAIQRAFRKYGKGMFSKVILNTNPTWALIQVAGNESIAALAGINPLNKVQAARFFRENPEARRNMVGRLGTGALSSEQRQHRIGSGAPSLVRAYEDWKDANPWTSSERLAKANPLDWLGMFDHWQNAKYREGAAYGLLRRQERDLRKLDPIVRQLVGGHDEATKLLAIQDPRERLVALTRNADVVEHVGRLTDEMFGNYARYSPAERKLLEGNIMFYGYLRFSLRFALTTLPFKHPLVSNLLANVSSLQEDEVRRLFDVKPGDPLPIELLASFYSRDAKGHIRQVNLGRLNPLMNALTQSQHGGQLIAGLASPAITEAASQLLNADLYRGKGWKLNGEAKPLGLADWKKAGLGDRLRVLLGDAGNLAAPYRGAEQTYFAGEPQGDDANLITGKRPTRYKDVDTLTSIELGKLRRDGSRYGLPADVVRSFVDPFASRPSYAEGALQRAKLEQAAERDDPADTTEIDYQRRMLREYGGDYRKALRRGYRLQAKREVEDLKRQYAGADR